MTLCETDIVEEIRHNHHQHRTNITHENNNNAHESVKVNLMMVQYPSSLLDVLHPTRGQPQVVKRGDIKATRLNPRMCRTCTEERRGC